MVNDTRQWRKAKDEVREALRRIGRGKKPATAADYERLCNHLCQYVMARCGGQIGEDEAGTIVMECLLLALPPLYLRHSVHYEINHDALFSMLADRVLQRFCPSSPTDSWPITPSEAARTDLETVQHIFGAETTIEHYQSAIKTLWTEQRDFDCLFITQYVDMGTSGVVPTVADVLKKLWQDGRMEAAGTRPGRQALETFTKILKAQNESGAGTG